MVSEALVCGLGTYLTGYPPRTMRQSKAAHFTVRKRQREMRGSGRRKVMLPVPYFLHPHPIS